MATVMKKVEKADYDSFMKNMKTKYLKVKEVYDDFNVQLTAIAAEDPFYPSITSSENPAIEIAMLQGAYNVDNSFGTTTFSTYLKSNSAYTAMIRNFETAIGNGGGYSANTLDAFLFENNILEDSLGNDIYTMSKNNSLLAYNVGCPTKELMGSFTISQEEAPAESSSSSSSSSSSISLTNDYSFNTRPLGIYSTAYSATRRATLTKDSDGVITSIAFAPSQIRFKRTAGTGQIVLQITGVNTAGTTAPVTETVTIPSSGGEATSVNKYVYLTSVVVTTGKDGQKVEFYNIPYEVFTLPEEESSSSTSSESSVEPEPESSSSDSSESSTESSSSDSVEESSSSSESI